MWKKTENNKNLTSMNTNSNNTEKNNFSLEKVEETSVKSPKFSLNNFFNEKTKYIDFSTRLFICVGITLFFIITSVFFLFKSLDFRESREVEYKEVSNLDYKVCLKDNTFFEKKCLNKDMLYVASLIDKLRFDFGYTFSIDEPMDINFDYSIVAKLKILDDSGSKIYYEKDYTLLNKKETTMRNEMSKSINEKVTIDYNAYNNVANAFKNNFGLNTTSKLDIYFKIHKGTGDTNKDFFAAGDTTTLLVSVPLSERSVQIKLDYKNINHKSSLINSSKVLLNDVFFLTLAIILFGFAVLFLVKTLLLLKLTKRKKSKYEEYIDKILKEYDRLIVVTKTAPYIRENDKTIYIDSFEELLDVCNKTKEPILYYNIVKGQKCNFYINHEDKVYLTIIKAVDMEKANEEE